MSLSGDISTFRDGDLNPLGAWYEKAVALEAENAKLRAALVKAKRSHYYCEDPWYSCPKAEDGCADEQWPKGVCNCGADEFNAEIDALLQS